jgi:hypothetical protein
VNLLLQIAFLYEYFCQQTLLGPELLLLPEFNLSVSLLLDMFLLFVVSKVVYFFIYFFFYFVLSRWKVNLLVGTLQRA